MVVNLIIMKKIFRETKYIFPAANFITGMGSILDIGGNYYKPKYHNNPDYHAIVSDWEVVGNDMRQAMGDYHDKLSSQSHQMEMKFKENG